MFTVIIWLMVIVSVFLVGAVLVQKSKGGGLTQNFASQTQIMGVRKSADFIETATWTLAGAMFVFSLAAVAFLPSGSVLNAEAEVDQALPTLQVPAAAPSFDAQAPAADVATEAAPEAQPQAETAE